MTSEMISKKKYAWNPITKLARQYQTKIKATYRKIDEHIRSGTKLPQLVKVVKELADFLCLSKKETRHGLDE